MKFVLILSMLFFSANLCAQYAEKENNKADTTRTSYLDEIVVSANRIGEQRKTVAQQVKIMGPGVIANLNVQNSADLLANSGVVAVQKSQQGGGSPILRGFEASRVLLVIDGVRMNNAIYRAGHLQNVITMDNAVLERAEILFGPSSTVYGSDALGGVIHFYTRTPEFSQTDNLVVKGNSFVRYGSVNNEKTGHIDITLGKKKFSSLSSFTYSDFGDLKMGERTNPSYGKQFGLRQQYAVRAEDNVSDVLVANQDPFVQKFSGYQQYDVLQKFVYAPNKNVQHQFNFQYSTSSNIPRYDRLTDPQGSGLRFAQWYYGPQQRLMASYNVSVSNLGKMADELSVTTSYQNIEESRHDRRFNSNNRNNRIENIDVLGLTVDFSKAIGKNKLRYGIDGQFNDVTSVAYRTDITTGAKTNLDTRYPDGDNTMSTLAAFVTHTLLISDNWTLNDGVRVGGSWLHVTFNDKTFFPFPYDNIKQNNGVVSGNLGVIYTPSSWKVSLMTSTGFRVPNIDDLAKVFESVAGTPSTTGILVVPNPELKPEKTLNGDLSIIKFFGDVFRVESVFFVTRFFDAIVTRPSAFEGQSTVMYNGFPANVVSSQNAANALLYGYTISLRADIGEHVVLTGAYNYTHGEVLDTNGPNAPLDHIAPAFGRVGVQYNTPKFKSELFSNFSGWKYVSRYSTSGEDNLQYATSEGMPSWYTINLRTSYDATKNLTLQAGVDNLLDLQYRTFASGINAPGRNLTFTVRAKI
jgi:hemoglobin/transferrin/lactoferrin receptor protein